MALDKLHALYVSFSALQDTMKVVDTALLSVSECLQKEGCCTDELFEIIAKFKEIQELVLKTKEECCLSLLKPKLEFEVLN